MRAVPHVYLTSYERAAQGLVGPSVVEVIEPEVLPPLEEPRIVYHVPLVTERMGQTGPPVPADRDHFPLATEQMEQTERSGRRSRSRAAKPAAA